jgi:hypothetical protein
MNFVKDSYVAVRGIIVVTTFGSILVEWDALENYYKSENTAIALGNFKEDPLTCPFCSTNKKPVSTSTSTGDLELEISKQMECPTCSKSWIVTYKMSGVSWAGNDHCQGVSRKYLLEYDPMGNKKAD